jgi:hypothetical protein
VADYVARNEVSVKLPLRCLTTFWTAAVAIATPRTRLPDAYAASRGSVLLHSFLSSRLASVGKLLGDLVADAEEYVVGSLSLAGLG